jgi:hypothetical protein
MSAGSAASATLTTILPLQLDAVLMDAGNGRLGQLALKPELGTFPDPLLCMFFGEVNTD